MPVNLLEFISNRLSFAQHANSILQVKTHLLFSRCLLQSQFRVNSSNNKALADQEISKVADYLIIQLKRFLVFGQAVTKDIIRISCNPSQTVPVALDKDIVGHKKFNLIATISYSGNLNWGQIFWLGCSTILVLSLGVTTPLIDLVTFSKGA